MKLSITHPEFLTVRNEHTTAAYFGGIQSWYTTERKRRAGCGPTSAAIVLAYLAFTRPALRNLYQYQTLSRAAFTLHMEEVYEYVTPGNMGLNHIDMYTGGVAAFAQSRRLSLTPHSFIASGKLSDRPLHTGELADFVKAGLASDCPLGFLSLSRGREVKLQNWHWITITSAEMDDHRLIAAASDEGHKIWFDLLLWYQTTRMHGGLVYFTE